MRGGGGAESSGMVLPDAPRADGRRQEIPSVRCQMHRLVLFLMTPLLRPHVIVKWPVGPSVPKTFSRRKRPFLSAS